jgi:membrane protein implicated in regulation of membrane protease activity
MEVYLIWILVGFGLIIAELLTGTFYLLMFGIAALCAALIAFFGLSFPLQTLAAVMVSVAGCWFVHLYRVKNAQQQMKPVDFAQPVVFEGWVDEGNRIARVRYRNAQWEANVEPGIEAAPGSTLYITTTEGNTLSVVKSRPEWKTS